MKDLERPFKALANRRRLAILKHLKQQKEASVTELAEAIRLSFKATSKHLSILAGVSILEREQKSLQVFYRFSNSSPIIARQAMQLI